MYPMHVPTELYFYQTMASSKRAEIPKTIVLIKNYKYFRCLEAGVGVSPEC
jgi:hypothetical protein